MVESDEGLGNGSPHARGQYSDGERQAHVSVRPQMGRNEPALRLLQENKQRPRQGLFLQSGAEESRTPDLIIANDALYQLSYRPDAAVGTRALGGA